MNPKLVGNLPLEEVQVEAARADLIA